MLNIKDKSVNSLPYLYRLISILSFGVVFTVIIVDRIIFYQTKADMGSYIVNMSLVIFPFVVTLIGSLIIIRKSYIALEKQLQEREKARHEYFTRIEKTYQSLMSALISALDTRDHLAQGHSQRVVAYALAIGDRLGISPAERRDLAFGGYLHDLGKIALDDALLRKETSLNDLEWIEMRRHPIIGHEILREVDFIGSANEVILYHHERYDGSGYPYGLSGKNIPLLARIFAVVDALDAMSAFRPYRKAVSFQIAREQIVSLAGKQFCPDCVQAFSLLSDEELQKIRSDAEEGREVFFGFRNPNVLNPAEAGVG